MDKETCMKSLESIYKALDGVNCAGIENQARITGAAKIILDLAKEFDNGNIMFKSDDENESS